MHAIITLSIAFSVLVTYLENTVNPEQPVASLSSEPTVIRTAKIAEVNVEQAPKQVTHASEKAVEMVRAITPLNLSIPFSQSNDTLKFQRSKPVIDLFNYSGKPEVTYNAELVYDAEKGEDITGGKINIRIPLG
jgi:hypothetical protein